jgi:hypothetical protein
MIDMHPLDVAWLAGLYEGEGTLGLTTPGSGQLTISMTDPDVIARCRMVTGLGQVRLRTTLYPGETKPRNLWTVGTRAGLMELLPALRPYLGLRRRAKVDEVLASLALGDRRRRDIVHGAKSGSMLHRRRHEPACALCRAARNAAYAQGERW